jgi:hypothetical protein
MNVGELRALLAALPADLPVVIRDDLNVEPVRTTGEVHWHWDGQRWGSARRLGDPDCPDPDELQRAFLLTARGYLD